MPEIADPVVSEDAPRYIALNQAKCLSCGDIISSISRHDYVTCSCGNLSVDGGSAYLRRSVKEGAQWQERTFYTDHPFTRTDHTLENSNVIIHNVHPEGSCFESACTIHNMSKHVLRGAAQVFESGTMWRRCEHDALHPDPDEWLSLSMVRDHVCCAERCCAGAYTPRLTKVSP